ncbi:MAG TPA: hypothetical protein VF593_14270 [Chthoniobacteraceae bacterium]|jgi:hypothetical protein
MKNLYLPLAAVAVLFAACDARVNVPAGESDTTIVNPPGKSESNTTVVNPPAAKTENNTTVVNPPTSGSTTEKNSSTTTTTQ